MPDVSTEQLRQVFPLASVTTLRLGGPARRVITASSADEIAQSVRDVITSGEPTLVLGGGSNVVIPDAGFAGTVILVRSRGVEVLDPGSGADRDLVTIRVAAGEPWDDVVALAVASGWSGLECLSGIPGSAGGTPIQNVGAYGQEVSETIVGVEVLDRDTGRRTRLPADACGFGYRTSVFKHSQRYVVLSVDFRLRRADVSAPVRYPELARALDCPVGATAPLSVVREAVLALRARKGMVLDETDRDTWSAGSFFTNPVLTASAAEALRRRTADLGELPTWPVAGAASGAEQVKVSAAWLIERAGFHRGYGRAGVAISGKHTLALTNRGHGTTAALLALAAEVRDGVRDRFGVTLYPEPVLVNCTF